ncbi:MAG: hypothetical protein ACLQGU_09440 [bacterium]
MSQNIFRRNSVIALWLLIVLSATWVGCTTTVKERQQGQPAGEATSEEGMGKYYYFDDVRVPSELNYRQNKSFVYETPGFKAGILVFSKWRLDVDSLMDFFNYQMGKDNWKAVNSFKGKESILNFSKPDKTCTIKIVEKWYGTTVVEIRVGPLGEKKM